MRVCNRLACLTGIVTFAVLGARPAAAQALAVDSLGNGTVLIHVAQPLSDATSVAWPGGDGEPISICSGRLTLAADLREALGDEQLGPAPPVVVAVGVCPAREMKDLVRHILAERSPAPTPAAPAPALVEGGVERRLGSPGGEALLRLAVPLPGPGDPSRAAAEVIWELLPDVVGGELPGLQGRVEGDRGLLEARVDPELAEIRLSSLRLNLARAASAPEFTAQGVEMARIRLQVQRRAKLENHPDAARLLVRLWLQGRDPAVRGLLFGLHGVTRDGVIGAARQWLSLHPGAASLILPPRVFSPRFSQVPQPVRLGNDLSAVLAVRPGAPLAALVLRPVLLADVDGEISATVLARLASEVRRLAEPPGWVRVRTDPPLIELAAPAGGFAGLCEALRQALPLVNRDTTPVSGVGRGARRRALGLMGGLLGLDEGSAVSAADLLKPDNVALGVVTIDGEAAEEAMKKLLMNAFLSRTSAEGRALTALQRTREAVSGTTSTLAISLPLAGVPGGAAVRPVVGELLLQRAGELLGEFRTEILKPLVPGRKVIVVLVSAELPLDELEERVRGIWPLWMSGVAEEELAGVRRRVAASAAAAASGALGRARTCAAVAAGEKHWRSPGEVEMETLTVSCEAITAAMAGLATWDLLQTSGAGVLPIGLLGSG